MSSLTNKPMTAEEYMKYTSDANGWGKHSPFTGGYDVPTWMEMYHKHMSQSAQQQPQVELHPCDCGHNVPNEFVHSNDDGVTVCSKCMMEYKNDKIQQLQEKLHDMDVLAEMNAEACQRASEIFRKDHPDFVSRNAWPNNTTAINYVCDLLEKQQPQVSELPSEADIESYSHLYAQDKPEHYPLMLANYEGAMYVRSIAEKAIAYEEWKAVVFAEWADSCACRTKDGWMIVPSYKHFATTTELYNCEEFKEYLEKRRKEEGK